MTEVALLLRLMAASIVLVMAIGKIASEDLADRMWHPELFSRRVFRALVRAVVLIELLFGLSLLWIATNTAILAIGCLVLFVVLTAYGMMALGFVADCGCSGGGVRRGGRKSNVRLRLFVRNLGLFGAAFCGICYAPQVAVPGEAAQLLWTAAVAPFVLVLAVVFWRLLQSARLLIAKLDPVAGSI